MSNLETESIDLAQRFELNERELSENRIQLQQHEVKMKTLQQSIAEQELKKRELEEMVDLLNEECAKLKSGGMLLLTLMISHLTSSARIIIYGQTEAGFLVVRKINKCWYGRRGKITSMASTLPHP